MIWTSPTRGDSRKNVDLFCLYGLERTTMLYGHYECDISIVFFFDENYTAVII